MGSILKNARTICRNLLDNRIFSTCGITRREAAQLCGLSYQDFSYAEDYLLEKGYVSGTLGGLEGIVFLTASGIDFIESEVRDSHLPPIVINNNNEVNVSEIDNKFQATVNEKKASSDRNKKNKPETKQSKKLKKENIELITAGVILLTAVITFFTPLGASILGKKLPLSSSTPTFYPTPSLYPTDVNTTTTLTPSDSDILSYTVENTACSITSLNIYPDEVISAGALLTISVKAECNNGVKRVHFEIFNTSSQLIGESEMVVNDQNLNNSEEISRSWTTTGFSPGQYVVKVEVLNARDYNWTNIVSIEKELSISPKLPIRALVLEIPDYIYSDIFWRLEQIGILFERIPMCSKLTYYDLREYQVVYIPAGWGTSAGCLDLNASAFEAFVEQGGGILVEEANARPNYTTSFLPNNVTFLSPDYQEDDFPPYINEREHYLVNNLYDYELIPGPQDLISPNESYTIITSGVGTFYPALLVNEFGEGRVIISTSNPSRDSAFQISDDIWLRMFIWLAQQD